MLQKCEKMRYNGMTEQEAQKIVTAYAACSIVDGCRLCPLYDEAREKIKQQFICQEQINAFAVRTALIVIRGM